MDPAMRMEAQRVNDICSEADTFFIVTAIGAGLAILGGGAGIGLLTLDLLDDGGDAEASGEATVGRLELAPSVRRDGGGLQATLHF